MTAKRIGSGRKRAALALPALALAGLLAGCMGSETASRAMGLPPGPGQGPALRVEAVAPLYDVRAVRVIVPEGLKVSEANLFYPIADIVWRGDPLGDRHAQVQAIFDSALGRATAGMHRGRPALVTVELRRFHALTEKARYLTGGVNTIRFVLTVTDAETGAPLDGPRVVDADFHAVGGQHALDLAARGQTEKVIVTDHLVSVFLHELSRPAAAPGPLPALSDAGAALPAASEAAGALTEAGTEAATGAPTGAGTL